MDVLFNDKCHYYNITEFIENCSNHKNKRID